MTIQNEINNSRENAALASYNKQLHEQYTSEIVKILKTKIDGFNGNEAQKFLSQVTRLVEFLEYDELLRVNKKFKTPSTM